MGAQDAIELAFKDVLKEKPYKKVTVSEICERAGVSRKAFYTRFSGKEAIVASLFEKHAIKPLRDLRLLLGPEDRNSMAHLINVRMYEHLYEEREYYVNLVRPMRGNDDTFLRVVTNAIYEFNMNHVATLANPPSDWRRDYAAYFFASSQAMYMQKWMSDKMAVPPRDLADLYSSMTMQYWKNLPK